MKSDAFNSKNIWKPVLVGLALAFLYGGVLIKLGRDWWTDENYSHGLLMPLVIGFIIWLELESFQKIIKMPRVWLGGVGILLALLMLLGGILGAEIFTQRISFVLMVAAIIVYFFGAKILQLLVAPFILLLLAIPVPQIIFNKIAFPLQIYASQIAVWGIRLFYIPTIRKGNVFEILPRGAMQVISLEVVEACSGIRSLMTLVTLALVLAYFTRLKREFSENGWLEFFKNTDVWRAILLMVAAIPIAVLTNAARVTATGVLTYYYGKQVTEGSLHEILGLLVYVAALGLLFAVNVLLKKVQSSKFKVQSQIETKETEKFEESKDFSSFSVSTSKTYLLLFVLLTSGIFINWFQQRGEASVERKPLAKLPQTLGDWHQKGDEMRFGAATESVLRVSDYTQRYYVAPDGRIANLYVGYYASQRAGVTYHSPQNCLPGAGWIMREPQTVEIRTPNGKVFTANRFRIENGEFDEIMIYWYQGRGRAEASEYRDKINTVLDSAFRRRSDGAMIRVMTSVGNDEAAANQAALDLSARLADNLDEFVPE